MLLDNGIMGIVFPDVNTAAEAKRAVDRAKYSPLGRRSVAGGFSVFDYRALSTGEAVKALDENTLVVCMIETPEALANVDAIAAVPGVDVVHVGSNDLLTAMGIPGAYGTPEHLAALDKVFAACNKHGKVAGVGGDRNVARHQQAEYMLGIVRDAWRITMSPVGIDLVALAELPVGESERRAVKARFLLHLATAGL